MRVPVYQQQVTPQIPVERSQVTVPEGAAGVAVKPVDTTQGLVQGVESLRLGLVKLNENREKFMLASAVNDYRRQNTEFLHAKDTGIFAKKGKNVFGATQQYDEFSSKAMEDIAKRYKMSGVARDRFIEATSALYNASLSSVMTHEQRETDAAQQMEWKTMINDSLNAVALSYNDDAVCEENWRIMAGAIVQQNEQYGDQVVQSKLAEARSQLQIARLAPMLEDNPKAADAFLKTHLNEFTGEDRLKAQKAVDNKMEVIKVQETTDFLVKKFRGNEQAALQFAHKNFEGPFENSLVSSLKSRYSEMKIRSIGAASARAQAQNSAFKQAKPLLSAGYIFTEEQIAQMPLSDEQKNYIRVQNDRNMQFSSILKNLDKLVPEASGISDENERYLLASRLAGVTDTERDMNFVSLSYRLGTGEADADDVKLARKNGDLLPKREKMLLNQIKIMQSENAGVYTSVTNAVDKNLDIIEKENPILAEAVYQARKGFREFANNLKVTGNTGSFEKQLSTEGARVLEDLCERQIKDQDRKMLEGTQAVLDLAQRMKSRSYGSSWCDPASVMEAAQRLKRSGADRLPLVTRTRGTRPVGGNSGALANDGSIAAAMPQLDVTSAPASRPQAGGELAFNAPPQKKTADTAANGSTAANKKTVTGKSSGLKMESELPAENNSGPFPSPLKVSAGRAVSVSKPAAAQTSKEEIAERAANWKKGGSK